MKIVNRASPTHNQYTDRRLSLISDYSVDKCCYVGLVLVSFQFARPEIALEREFSYGLGGGGLVLLSV